MVDKELQESSAGSRGVSDLKHTAVLVSYCNYQLPLSHRSKKISFVILIAFVMCSCSFTHYFCYVRKSE